MSESDKHIEAREGSANPASAAPAGAGVDSPAPGVPSPPEAGGESQPAPGPIPAVAAARLHQQFGHMPMGRRYGFLCSYCSSRLEAVESMAGQSGTCPTCGNSIVIPILDSRGRLIDPTSGQVIKQDPHPVHAYAAAGHKAPQIVTVEVTGERFIKCPRCARQNTLSSNNCLGCGLPFTMEGTVGDSVSGTNTWAVASLVLGIVSLAGGCMFIVPPILAIVFGFIALRTTNQATGQSTGQGLALGGLIMGVLGVVIGGLFWANVLPGI